jgi:cellulose biosynthesis protein BcsQ
MRIISFMSQKGGVGKSTACVNLAAVLAERGYRILILDLDANSCASQTFGAVGGPENSITAALLGEQPLPSLIRGAGINGIFLVPGTTLLSTLDEMQVARPERLTEKGRMSDEALALELSQLARDQFDFVFIDCPGGQVFMEQLALLASDEVIVPTGLSVFDLFGATPTLQLLAMAQEIRSGRPQFLGFLPTGASSDGVPHYFQAELDQYRLPCFTPVRHSALMRSIANAPDVQHRVVINARPASSVAESYRQVAREIELGINTARAGQSSPTGMDAALEIAAISEASIGAAPVVTV